MRRTSTSSGRGVAVALALTELTAMAMISLAWAASYWSWDPQHYGDPPTPYLAKAFFAAIFAAIAAVVAGTLRMRTVAISQAVLSLAISGLLLGVKDAGQHIYESSYRHACQAGVVCDSPPVRR